MRNAIRNLLLPQACLTPEQVDRGVRRFIIEGAATMGLGSMTGGGFIAAYALVLGANSQQIGIVVAVPFITMPLQVFTVAAAGQLMPYVPSSRRREGRVQDLSCWA